MMTNSLERELLLGATEEQQKIMAEVDCRLMEQMALHRRARRDNLTEQYDVPTEKSISRTVVDDPVHHRDSCAAHKMVVVPPHNAMAQSAKTSLE